MKRLSGLQDFFLIWTGQLVSAVGSRLSSFALGIWVLQTTGSTTRFAFTFIATALPAIVLSPIAGALVDRWDRRRTMIVCDVGAAVTMLVLAGLLATGHLMMWCIYAGIVAASVCETFRSPAFAASVPLIASREQLPRVNGVVQSGNAIAEIVGPLLAGLLVATVSLRGVLILDALTFVAGIVSLSLARVPSPPPVDRQRHSLWRETVIGWQYVHGRPGLSGLLAIHASNRFIFSIAMVLIAPLVLSLANPAMLGVQYAIGGVGLMLGGIAMAVWGGPEKKVHGVLGFSLLAGIALAAHGLRPSFTLVAAAGFILFLMLPIVAASNNALWQSKVPGALHGRCFALQQLVFNVATGIGLCLAGPLCDQVFEPLLDGGGLSSSVGSIIGDGPGRGIGLLFIVLGTLMALVASVAYRVSAVRNIDNLSEADRPPGNARTTVFKESIGST